MTRGSTACISTTSRTSSSARSTRLVADGLYTAPTDEALKFDIEMTKRLGNNMARKHVKVEPDRWYYWCDKLGLLVWQDMPSGDKHAEWDPFGKFDNTEITRSQESSDNFNKEWKAIIDALHNHPSIVMWVPFNEAWGQANTVAVTKWTMEYDPSRLVNCASGGTISQWGMSWTCIAIPSVPAKDYSGSGCGAGRVRWVGSPHRGGIRGSTRGTGAIGRSSRKKLWRCLRTARLAASRDDRQGPSQLRSIRRRPMWRSRVNGLFTYDREVLKFDEKRMREANLRVFGPPPTFKTLVPDLGGRRRRSGGTLLMTQIPWGGSLPSDNKDKFWNVGVGGFGNLNPPGSHVRTKWDTPDIWARRTFELKSIDDIQKPRAANPL